MEYKVPYFVLVEKMSIALCSNEYCLLSFLGYLLQQELGMQVLILIQHVIYQKIVILIQQVIILILTSNNMIQQIIIDFNSLIIDSDMFNIDSYMFNIDSEMFNILNLVI